MKQTPDTKILSCITCTIGFLFFLCGVKHAIWSLKHAVITIRESFKRFLLRSFIKIDENLSKLSESLHAVSSPQSSQIDVVT